MLEILLTSLESILTELHADLRGGIVHEVSVGAEGISVASLRARTRAGALLVGVSICALLLWLRRRQGWWRP